MGHLVHRLAQSAAAYPNRPALRERIDDAWQTVSYRDFFEQVQSLARALLDRGVQPGDRVVIYSSNRMEWSIADFAILAARAVVVPIYATSSADQVEYIIADSGASLVFVGGIEQRAALPTEDLSVIDFDDNFTAVVAEGRASSAELSLVEASENETASIIYTSGTTGVPKGVVLSHRAFTFQIDALSAFFNIQPTDHSLCLLPLSHALERGWSYVVFAHGCQNTFVRDPRQAAEMLVAAAPTLLAGVPVLYEKVYTVAHELAGSGLKRRIFDVALQIGQRAAGGRWLARLVRPLADVLVLRKVRHAVGGPKTVMACGGAPLRDGVVEFFAACGLTLCTGYGLTEASPLVSFNSPGDIATGTVGAPIPGGQIQIVPVDDAAAEDGEICYRAPNVMDGYWNAPQATAEVIRDGWLHTGDIGHLTASGHLVITDRMKDLIVTAGGKNVAPQQIEGLLLADEMFEHVVVLGDNRPFLTLLARPSLTALEDIAASLQLTWQRAEDLLTHQAVLDVVRERVAQLTARLGRWEQIKDLRLLIEEFNIENGLLTPTLKVRRREVERRFAAVIDDMYARLAELRKSITG